MSSLDDTFNNDNGGDLQAKTVSLTASTFNEVATPGYVDATLFDTAEEFSASSTSSTGQIYLDFDRTADLELTGIQSSGAVTIVLSDQTAVETPNLIIGVGNVAAGATAQVSLTADGGISSTTETGVVPGSITGGTATLTALDDAVDVTTAVGQIAVDAFGVTITQNGDVQIAPAGIDSDAGAGEITLNVVGGSILSGTGVLEGSSASLVVANNVDVLTNVDTLSVAAAGDIAVVETSALALGDGGIASEAGDVSLTLTAGGSGQCSSDELVVTKLRLNWSVLVILISLQQQQKFLLPQRTVLSQLKTMVRLRLLMTVSPQMMVRQVVTRHRTTMT